MSNLTKRFITAGVGILLIFAALFVYERIAVPAILLIFVVFLLWECSALLQIKGIASRIAYTGIGGLAFLFVITIGRETFTSSFEIVSVLQFHLYCVLFSSFICWVTLSDEMRRFWKSRSNSETPQASRRITVRISESTLTARIFLSIGCLLVLVGLGVALYGLQTYLGSGVLVCVLGIVWATDTGAFFAGRAFGKRPLAKHISPRKTVEGTIVGWLAGFVVALILGFWWLQPILGWPSIAVLGMAVMIPLVAIFGDLLASVFKRISDAKASGTILPGYGGVLDRVDSLLLVVPLVLSFSVLLGNTTQ